MIGQPGAPAAQTDTRLAAAPGRQASVLGMRGPVRVPLPGRSYASRFMKANAPAMIAITA